MKLLCPIDSAGLRYGRGDMAFTFGLSTAVPYAMSLYTGQRLNSFSIPSGMYVYAEKYCSILWMYVNAYMYKAVG